MTWRRDYAYNAAAVILLGFALPGIAAYVWSLGFLLIPLGLIALALFGLHLANNGFRGS